MTWRKQPLKGFCNPPLQAKALHWLPGTDCAVLTEWLSLIASLTRFQEHLGAAGWEQSLASLCSDSSLSFKSFTREMGLIFHCSAVLAK